MTAFDAITLKQLRTLRAIREAGSLSGAAELVHLTPPAVHTQLKTLEDAVGCQLVERGGGQSARLTAEGRILCDAQASIAASLDRAEGEIVARRAGRTGRVCLGVVSTGKYFAPRLVARINAAHPNIELVLRIGNRDEIILMLQQGVVDIVVMGRPPRDPAVTAQAIGDHPHVLIAPPDHPLLEQKRISAADILAQPLLARERGSGTRILMSRFLDRIGEGAPYRSIEMNSNETIKQAVMAGLGIALISQHTVMEELRTGRLVCIPYADLPIRRQWFLMHEQSRVPRGASATVHDFIIAQKGAFLPA